MNKIAMKIKKAMKINTRKKLYMLAGFSLYAGSSHAASLLVGFQSNIMSEQPSSDIGGDGAGERAPYRVSVNANNPGYASGDRFNNPDGTAGTPFERDFTFPVVAYGFVGGGTNNVLALSRSGGEVARISNFTTTDTAFDYFGQNNLQLWTTNDPGSNLAAPATTANSTGVGIRGISDLSNSIDISGLTSGSLIVIYGGFSALPTLTATMVDLDGLQPDIVLGNAHLNGDTANRTEYYAAELDFVNDLGYDRITYIATGGTGGRQGGVVLTAVPEPTTTMLGGLGLLALLRRRR